jgi:hypothetical protein
MEEEKMILAHEAVPPYRIVFYISVIIGFSYLGFIFVKYVI